ncbi:DUF4192 family protein [Microbacterium invictum]|uniref:Lipopolysaccharide biosynthesis protein n=1 Tax=Microbacterium invictum TaxID=515415 RepID=A0AA40SQ28_9MICO|nr:MULTISPECIES: DUF4192 family protein [Microbacterium]MBB4140303.1 hypothetical protein [Microbacterium invictum]
MSTIVTVADAAQFLSLVPRLLGYTPSRSIVLVPMADGRSAGAMRVDLPPGDDPGTVDPVASTIVGMMCRIAAVDAFVVIVYTDAGVSTDGGALPHAALVEALSRCAEASGIRVVDALTVGADGWGSHLDAGSSDLGSGPQVRPLDELLTTTAPPVRGDQASGAELPPSSAALREAVSTALRSLRASLELICGVPATDDAEGYDGDDQAAADEPDKRDRRIDPQALAAACELDDLPRLYERALGWDAGWLRPLDVALLAWCLARPALRDVALVQWSGDVVRGEDALEAQRRWEDVGADYPSDLASVLWGEGPRPDPARLERALELCRRVATASPVEQRAGALAACAWVSWALGRSTHADRYAAMAHEIDDEHGLAAIVRSFVTAGHLPDWAFRGR